MSDAIASASAGDTLIVMAGRHAGPLIVDKPLHIRGKPGAIIDAGGLGSAIQVKAADVTIESLTVIGSGDGHQPTNAGIQLTEIALRAQILNNVLTGNQFGIDIHGAQDALVSGNTITGRQGHRMNERGNGIYLWNAPGTVIQNNHVRYGRDGYSSLPVRGINSSVIRLKTCALVFTTCTQTTSAAGMKKAISHYPQARVLAADTKGEQYTFSHQS